MISKEKLATVGAEKLADILLSLYESHKDMQKHLGIIFSGLDEDPKKIISMIKKEISALKRSTKFVDYYESDSLAGRLDHLRLCITNDLLSKSPRDAMELMMGFLDLHESVLNRVDDSNGTVSGVFFEACSDLGKITEQTKVPITDLVDLVFERFMNNGYGVYDGLIHHLKDSLQENGLQLLQERIEQALTKKNEIKVKLGLESIADCKKDVDAYIRACSFIGEPSAHDHLDIAKRLIEHWRAEEALKWLDSMKIPHNHPWKQDYYKLKIQALELKGDYEKAQNERLSWFEENLSPEVYGQVLKYAKPEFKEPFRQKAIEKAFGFSEPHIALNFLMQTQEFEEGARFVRLRFEELQGRQYYTLRPAADLLRAIDPFAATLLYRKMIQPVLEETKSKYYNYAAKDLVMCGILNSKITAWEPYQNHDLYFKQLEDKHKRKISFWAEYRSALQKQAAKEAKQLASQNP